MNDGRGNIRDWLKAAAEQPDSGVPPQQEDLGWAEMSAMLDDAPEHSGAGYIPFRRSRRGKWLIAATVIVALTAGLFVLSDHITEAPWKRKAHGGDSTREAAAVPPFAAAGAGSGEGAQEKADLRVDKSAGKEGGENQLNKTAKKEGANNRLNKSTGKEHVDNPSDKGLPAVHTDNRSNKPADHISTENIADISGKQSNHTNTADLSLHPVPTLAPFTARESISLSGPAPDKLPVRPFSYPRSAPRWMAQAGGLLAGSDGYGGRISVLYQLPIGKRFYLQPYIGASYAGGYEKNFLQGQTRSVENANGTYRIDSVKTRYEVKSTISADAGIRIGYAVKQFSFGTGIRYNRILRSNGSTNIYVRTITNSSPTSADTSGNQPFSRSGVPGQYSFSWEVEAAYRWRSGLQAGVSYHLRVQEPAPGPMWKPAVPNGGNNNSSTNDAWYPGATPSLQDKGRLEIYLRIPLKRK